MWAIKARTGAWTEAQMAQPRHEPPRQIRTVTERESRTIVGEAAICGPV
jgi:hypothetical protein